MMATSDDKEEQFKNKYWHKRNQIDEPRLFDSIVIYLFSVHSNLNWNY